MNIDDLLAARVRELRKAQALTLDALAQRSGVSRSMISLIERGETSPTAAVLSKLADAFSVPLAALFAQSCEDSAVSPLACLDQQQVWTDPATGYVRRHLTPVAYGAPLELVEVIFPPGQSVRFENAMRQPLLHQQIWILEGRMTLTMGDEHWTLQAGDCLAMELGQSLVFANTSRHNARYVLAQSVSRKQG